MLKKSQAASGMLIAVCVLVHLVNLWLAPLGAEVYNTAQNSLQRIYQWPPFEIALLTAIFVHLAIGVIAVFTQAAPKTTRYIMLRTWARSPPRWRCSVWAVCSSTFPIP